MADWLSTVVPAVHRHTAEINEQSELPARETAEIANRPGPVVLVSMPQDSERGPRDEYGPTPMMQGRPVEREPEGDDPILVAARWTLQGGEPEPEESED